MAYREIVAKNPFGAPVFFCEETGSTMHDIRQMAVTGAHDGTVVLTESQTAGRGRIEGRRWTAPCGESLLFSVMLRRKPLEAFSLRIGLAVAQTVDFFLYRYESTPTHTATHIKWPNDVLCFDKKIAGILCESDGDTLYVGIGINIAQIDFTDELSTKATSLRKVLEYTTNTTSVNLPSNQEVLEFLLEKIKFQVSSKKKDTAYDWNAEIKKRLWKCGERISFRQGDPSSECILTGILEGIGQQGELLLGTDDGKILPLYSGELSYTQKY